MKRESPKRVLLEFLSKEKLFALAHELGKHTSSSQDLLAVLSQSVDLTFESLAWSLNLDEAFSAMKILRRYEPASEPMLAQSESALMQLEARIDALISTRTHGDRQLSLFGGPPISDGSFLDAAYLVLDASGHPLTASELVARALSLGLIKTGGRTPERTMAARLSEDIQQEEGRSRFMRTMPAVFALRKWARRIQEYKLPTRKTSRFDEDVLVFPLKSLASYNCRPGTIVKDLDWERLNNELRVMQRSEAEKTYSVVQLVSFFIVESESLFFTYMRGSRLPESRLQGEFSIGIGGHLGPDDQAPLFNFLDPQHGESLMLRELFEELEIQPQDIDKVTFAGVLYDDSRPVSRQHLALVYHVAVRTPDLRIAEPGFLFRGKFETSQEILAHIGDFENWSRIVIGSFVDVGRLQQNE